MNNFSLPNIDNCCVAIIGMGYVGLPLAIELASKKDAVKNKKTLPRKIICFDINNSRINELKRNFDKTNEVSEDDLKNAENIIFTNKVENLDLAEVFIVTVPTQLIIIKNLILPLINATTIGKALKSKSNIQSYDLVNIPSYL